MYNCVCCALSKIRSHIQRLQVQVDSLIGPDPPKKFHVQETTESGVYPDWAVAGTWNTRHLSTVVTNDIGESAYVQDKVVTLPIGVYDVVARAPGSSAGEQRLRLTNTGTGEPIVVGASVYAGSMMIDTVLAARIELSSETKLILSHYRTISETTDGSGAPTNLGIDEIYSEIIFYKIR